MIPRDKLHPSLRSLRKHRVARVAIVVFHVVFFFPTLFMQRVVSPNDVFYNFNPWASVRTADVQNSLMDDPPTAYYTVLSLLKTDWRAFHWNPFIACGVPGFGSTLLSPFSLLPGLFLPMTWIYTGIILLKLNVAFWFAYLWLREEGLGKRGAAAGAIIFAASGAIALRWLWHVTNATPLYPALLWIALRTARGKRTPVWAVGLIAVSYALSAFPATMAYGAYAAATYFLFLVIRERRIAPSVVATVAMATILGIAIASPSFVALAQLVRRTGYLGVRASAAAEHFFPLHHFLMFLSPDRLGNNAYHDWRGDHALGLLNNYLEATVYVGLIAVPLVLVAAANRRARSRWFWLGALAVILAAMFGFTPVARVFAALPGFKYSSLTRLQLMLPIAVAYLAAAGAALLARGRFRISIAMLIVVVAAADLAVFAGRFHPYLEPGDATPPVTPTIAFLQAQPKPFRIAPTFDYFWPNAAELYQLEDIRSHFSSEATYRRILERIDPSSALHNSTVLNFNSLQFNFSDPFVSMLGVRYIIEQKDIDIIRWSIFKGTRPGVKEIGAMMVNPGSMVQRQVRVDAEPFYAIELPVSVEDTTSLKPCLNVSLIRGSQVVYTRAFTPSDIEVLGKVYLPLRPFARLGETVVLRVRAVGMRARLLTGAINASTDAPIFYGRVTTPIIFDRQLSDGRLFVNVGEVPRFHAVSKLRAMTTDQFFATNDVDFGSEAIVTDVRPPRLEASDAVVTLRHYAENEQVVDVSSPANTFLATSEKLTPELGVTVDGQRVRPVEINALFAGVPLAAGEHRVVFSRRLGRRWWPVSAGALLMLIAFSVVDVAIAARRR